MRAITAPLATSETTIMPSSRRSPLLMQEAQVGPARPPTEGADAQHPDVDPLLGADFVHFPDGPAPAVEQSAGLVRRLFRDPLRSGKHFVVFIANSFSEKRTNLASMVGVGFAVHNDCIFPSSESR